MGLIDLPLELVQAIVAETVWLVGPRQAARLRLVSKLFDTQVQRAIYALPAFDGFRFEEHLLPEALCLPGRMGPSMTTRLILSKMRTKDSEKRPLYIAITRAVAHLENRFGQKEAGLRLEFIEALAGAAARALPLHDIVDCLLTDPAVLLDRLQWIREKRFLTFNDLYPRVNNPPRSAIDYLTPTSHLYTNSAPQDALIAVLYTKRFQLAKQLLKGSMEATTRSPAFGVPIQVAATMGAQEVVQIILDGLLGQGKEENVDTPDIMKRARRYVLQGAAAGGHEHIVRMILDDLELDQESLRKGLSRFAMSAVENGHEDVASLLLQYRTPIMLRKDAKGTRADQERRELQIWHRLSQEAARRGCKNLLRIASESAARVRHKDDKPPLVEDTFLGPRFSPLRRRRSRCPCSWSCGGRST